jgi:hypothetical protein
MWKNLGVVVKTNKHGVVDGASNHKTLFDEMIWTVNNNFLDYSSIDINEQNSWNIEQIRKGLNKEFKWNKSPMALHVLKRSLVFFMKQ